MTVLRSRAELAAQPRTMQFVVERTCPFVEYSSNERQLIESTEFPFVMWVEADRFTDVPSADPRSTCQARSYHVGSREVSRALKRSMPDRRVCEHMGHLIE